MMQLKLLGVLQDFGSPYASLYINGASNTLYIDVQLESDEPKIFCSLLLLVSNSMVNDYMNGEVGIRQLSQISTERYIWKRKKGQKGSMVNTNYEEIAGRLDDDDDKFDSLFCQNAASLHYYINQNK